MEKKVPFAKYNGRMVAPEEVEKHCTGLTCPDCGLPLMVRKGDKRIHHFAHINGAGGATCGETALHLMAKQIIADAKQITTPEAQLVLPDGRQLIFPQRVFQFQSALEEYRIDDIIPDILLVLGNNKLLAVEIYVRHRVDEEKIAKLNAKRISAIEIDLSNQIGISKDDLTKLLMEGIEHKKWLSLFVNIPVQQQPIPVPRKRPVTRHFDLDNLQPYSRKNYSNRKRPYYKKRKQH